jgi:adenosylcobinamide kinase/adenosylcobinamide-phosphate guanylyltransferase
LKSILLIGGARSGKSYFAQELARKSGEAVLFVATAEAGDEEMKRRIEEHRKARPSTWTTLEARTRIGGQIKQKIGKIQMVIIDCITLLINNVIQEYDRPEPDVSLIEKAVMAEIDELVDCIDRVNASFIIVTNEVGLGLVPADKTSRIYRDLLGRSNQILAQHVDEVYLMTAGIPLKLKPNA